MTAISGALEKNNLFFLSNPRAQFHVISFIQGAYPDVAKCGKQQPPLCVQTMRVSSTNTGEPSIGWASIPNPFLVTIRFAEPAF
jgi:hypothetical protein